MQLTHLADAAAFMQRAGAFLEAHEAEHCLLLGIAATLIQRPDPARLPPYLAVVEDAGAVVAVAEQTPPFNVVLSLTDTPTALALIAEDLLARGEAVPGVLGPAAVSAAFVRHWRALTGQLARHTLAERIYRLARVNPITGVPGQMRRIVEGDRALIRDWIVAFDQEALGNNEHGNADELNRTIDRYLTSPITGLYVWEDDDAVVAMAGHSGPTPHGMRIGPVYTPPERRGRGYASALVAALSQMLLDTGRQFCFLFTDLSNPTSNHIYQAIGYEPVCDVDVYTFG
jgi:predicted GNAT family acetyltransferase